MTDYKHLRIHRAPIKNPRRTRDYNIKLIKRPDKQAHGQKLSTSLDSAITRIKETQTTKTDTNILKIKYDGFVDFNNLSKHGVTFLSQETGELCVVYSNDEGLVQFSKNLATYTNGGDLTYKSIIEAIDEIDIWTSEDRKSWAIKNKGLPDQETMLLDIELWPIGDSQQDIYRLEMLSSFEDWCKNNSIIIKDRINLDCLVMYRLELSSKLVNNLLNYSDVRMVDLLPESGISIGQLQVDIASIPLNIPKPAEDAARVCILDSGIATNHPLLAPAIAESQSFIEGLDPFDKNGHGTAVASVALYGDLEACLEGNYWNPEILLFNAKILDDNANYNIHSIESSITKAVEYFANAHNCKIFNLSIGNMNAPYDGTHIRGLAYILDKLARDLEVLFIVSTGNFEGSNNLKLPKNSWKTEYPSYLLHETCTVIDPAPAINVLTVGSLAKHNATMKAQRYPEITDLCPANENQPSPFTRRGPSVKGAIKPELVAIGGNLASNMHLEQQHQPVKRGLGVLTCNSNFIGNTLFSEFCGTSFAAPYITHLAGRLLINYPDASINLIRALLVNHANLLTEIENTFHEDLKATYKTENKRDVCRDIAGYGKIDENELFRSTENVVVLLLEDEIENDTHHFIELPLPPEFLRTQRASREIRVTLAYCPVVKTTRQEYIATKISFLLVSDDSLESVQNHFNRATKEGFDTRNDDAKGNRDISSELRSKGTVQSSTWRMKQRKPDEKWFVVVTRQDKPWATGLSFEKEKYALVVTLADRENEDAQLYTQISQRIQQQVQQRVRV